MASRNIEPRLKSIDIKSFDTFDLLKFSLNRKSFFRDYQNLHSKSEGEVREIVRVVIEDVGSYNLSEEIRLCYYAAIQSEKRHTYYFNVYLIDLVELYLIDVVYTSRTQKIEEEDFPLQESSTPISYEWVLYSRILNPYQRYLLFEYLALGYSISDLAARRYCDTRTIYNKNIIQFFG